MSVPLGRGEANRAGFRAAYLLVRKCRRRHNTIWTKTVSLMIIPRKKFIISTERAFLRYKHVPIFLRNRRFSYNTRPLKREFCFKYWSCLNKGFYFLKYRICWLRKWVFHLRLACTCEETCQSVWPPNASLYPSSTCRYLRLFAIPFWQGLIHVPTETSVIFS